LAEEKFIEVIKEKMKLDLQGSGVKHPEVTFYEENFIHRSDSTQQNAESIKFVKFSNIWKRRQIYNMRNQLKDTGIYLNEDLDREERQIFYNCRMMKKKARKSWQRGQKT
jgi:hypothetical protein